MSANSTISAFAMTSMGGMVTSHSGSLQEAHSNEVRYSIMVEHNAIGAESQGFTYFSAYVADYYPRHIKENALL